MNPTRRIIVFTWVMAALVFLLVIPVQLLTFELKTPRDPTLPHIYLENLKANGMRVAILVALVVALWHTLDSRINRLKIVFVTYAFVWVGLGAYLSYVEIARPLPPPLVAQIGEHTYKVSRAFSPHFSKGDTLYSGGDRAVLSWKVCAGTLEPCAGLNSGIPAAQERLAHWPLGQFELVKNAKHDVLYEVPRIREQVLAQIFSLFENAGN